ncbi:polysaccharide lyase [Brucella cytisi]|jgi:hypothetical protein|uniref:polysaccharide lyase n=1 Tax=Brucella cytisi TaxID=407152 RepID=UPI0035DD53DA
MKGVITWLAALLFIPNFIPTPSAVAMESWNTPLVDDFEGADFSPSGGLYYRRNFEQSAGNVEFQSDVTFKGNGALKLSVKPHCPQTGENCSERAEIWEKTDRRVPYDQGIWYGFAVKFADPVPRGNHRYLIAQWKREIGPDARGDFSPFLALRLNNGKLFATVETNYVTPAAADARLSGAEGTPVWFRPDVNQMRALVATQSDWTSHDDPRFSSRTTAMTVIDRGNKLPSPESGWIDFAIYTKPGPDGSGHIEIFANNKWIVTVKGRIGHNDPGLGANQYFKFGPYRAADKTNWTLYYDHFRRSPRCEDVMDTRICPSF